MSKQQKVSVKLKEGEAVVALPLYYWNNMIGLFNQELMRATELNLKGQMEKCTYLIQEIEYWVDKTRVDFSEEE